MTTFRLFPIAPDGTINGQGADYSLRSDREAFALVAMFHEDGIAVEIWRPTGPEEVGQFRRLAGQPVFPSPVATGSLPALITGDTGSD